MPNGKTHLITGAIVVATRRPSDVINRTPAEKKLPVGTNLSPDEENLK